MAFLIRWHHTYRVCLRGHWYISCFQAKARRKHRHFHVHAGQLRRWTGTVIQTDVIVFQDPGEQKAQELSSGLKYVQKMIEQQLPELKRYVAVVRTWMTRVDSVEYFPGQRKTVRKEDTVMIQERVAGWSEDVEYDDTHDDLSRFRQAHPVLAEFVDISRRWSKSRGVISSLRALYADGVYHVNFVTLRCSGEVRGRGSGEVPQSPREDVTSWEDDDVPNRSTFSQRLVPSAPEPDELESFATEPEEPTVPDPEEDDPPPQYCEIVERSIEGLSVSPVHQPYRDSPPSYDTVVKCGASV